MKYVLGIIKRVNSSKRQRDSKKNRKYYFRYEFDVESGKFKRVRISTIKAIYYKITFIFGLKSRMIGQPIKRKFPNGTIHCKNCRKKYFSVVNFWDRNTDCPFC